MTLDAALAALVRAVVDKALAPVREEVRAVRALLEEERAEYLDTSALAARLGISAPALRERLRRGSALGAIAVELDGRRLWRRADVDALMRDGGGAR